MVKIKLYLDSCVFLRVWFNETLEEWRSFADSKKLLDEIINCTYNLVVSKLTLIELKKKMNINEDILLNYFLREFKIINKLEIINVTKNIAEEAVYFGGYYGIHKADALHAMLSKMNDCILVTLDDELYAAAKKFSVEVKKPGELIF